MVIVSGSSLIAISYCGWFGPRIGERSLFYHLIGAQPDRWRHLKAERLGGLEVDDISNFVGNYTGRSPGFSPRRMRST
jgi:hypothetical protein